MPATMASVINPTLPIPDRLVIEAGNRSPTTNPKADQVLAALTKAGAQLEPPTQTLGSTYRARFCEGARTLDQGMALGICEYANEADATKGLEISQKILKIPTRKVWRNKTTTMSIIEVQVTPANDALEAEMVDVFKKL